MDLLKKIGKRILPQAVIYFYHSVRMSRKMGSFGPLLRTLPNVTRKVRLGGEAGWTIPKDALTNRSVCYCVGCGEDISFDLELVQKYSCTVFAFDPTPRAIAYVHQHASHLPNYRFSEVAIWSDQGMVRFFVPGDQLGVSHSIANLDGTSEYIEVPSKRLKIFAWWPECKTIRPMPSRTRFCTRSTITSLTLSWAAWPHQVNTSVLARTASVNPCSG